DRDDRGEGCGGPWGDPPGRQGTAARALHARVDVPLAQLIEGVGPGRDQRDAQQRLDQHAHVHAPRGAEVEPRGGGEHHELRDARLGELEERYQSFSVMTASTRIAASGSGIMNTTRNRHRSNFRCMKNKATSSALTTASTSRHTIFAAVEWASRRRTGPRAPAERTGTAKSACSSATCAGSAPWAPLRSGSRS